MKTISTKIVIFLAVALAALPGVTHAQTVGSLEISAWIPYWRAQEGVESIRPQLSKFTEVNPFVYAVKQNGLLSETSSLSDPVWVNLRTLAAEMNVKFIPTVMWANPDAIDDILRNPTKRQEHIRSIAQAVYANRLDGIDIDYEAKYARTMPYFSLFLKELKEAIGFDKWIMCTIKARTPLDSRYETPEDIPTDIEYANDFAEINKHCDRVRIMAYDQGRVDLKLNAERGDPYAPVADRAWVEKVMRLAAQEIDKDKLVIGVPTYGYEYDMFASLSGSGEIEYARLWSFNPNYATDLAQKLGISASRNSAGELILTFLASQSPEPGIPLPFATRVLSWSDAESIRGKAELAKELGVRGIALFKIDGGQDANVWSALASYETNVKQAKKPPTSEVALLGSVLKAAALPVRDLELGSTGEDVRTVQRFLNANGFTVSAKGVGSPGNETIYFGPATARALINFQKTHNIAPARGYYGPITRGVIKSLQ